MLWQLPNGTTIMARFLCFRQSAILFAALFSFVSNTNAEDVERINQQLAELRTALLDALKEDSLWESDDRRDELILRLEQARLMRAPEASSILVTRIAYKPYGEKGDALLPLGLRFPAYAAIVDIGIPAVPALLEKLLVVDPDDRINDGQQASNLVIHCLVAIFEVGGNGAAMTRRRLELEAAQKVGTEKDRLLRALRHPMLRGVN